MKSKSCITKIIQQNLKMGSMCNNYTPDDVVICLQFHILNPAYAYCILFVQNASILMLKISVADCFPAKAFVNNFVVERRDIINNIIW